VIGMELFGQPRKAVILSERSAAQRVEGAAFHPQRALLILVAAITTAHAQNAEQVNRGQITINGGHYAYTIRRLPLSSFPDLPAPVREALDSRGCTVPQPFDGKRPDNVVSGSFFGKGSTGWAVLCSAATTTTLLVFASDSGTPAELGTHKDLDVLTQHPGSGGLGYAWAISTATPGDVQRISHLEENKIDHDGIKDEVIDQSSVLHYNFAGKWTTDNYY